MASGGPAGGIIITIMIVVIITIIIIIIVMIIIIIIAITTIIIIIVREGLRGLEDLVVVRVYTAATQEDTWDGRQGERDREREREEREEREGERRVEKGREERRREKEREGERRREKERGKERKREEKRGNERKREEKRGKERKRGDMHCCQWLAYRDVTGRSGLFVLLTLRSVSQSQTLVSKRSALGQVLSGAGMSRIKRPPVRFKTNSSEEWSHVAHDLGMSRG